jgi:hypothetical protein
MHAMSATPVPIAGARKCRASGTLNGYVHKFRLEAYEEVERDLPKAVIGRSLVALIARLTSAATAAAALLWTAARLLA